MNSTLYYRIYGDGMNEEVILGYIKYPESRYFYYLAEDHVWGVRFKVES